MRYLPFSIISYTKRFKIEKHSYHEPYMHIQGHVGSIVNGKIMFGIFFSISSVNFIYLGMFRSIISFVCKF
jgi:hypothetical protein